jgi:hypothetical protein
MSTGTSRIERPEPRPTALPQDKRTLSGRLPLRFSFAHLGVLVGLWGAEIASVKARAGLSAEALGAVLAFLPLGTLAGLRISRILSARWTHGRILAGSAAASTILLMLLVSARSAILVGLVLLLFGTSMCQANVAANHYGAMLEVAENRPLMSGLHAFFGYGLALGAGLAYLSHYIADEHLAIAVTPAALLIPVAFVTYRLNPVPSGGDPTSNPAVALHKGTSRPPILLLGVLSMTGAVAESGFSDWVGVYLNVHVGTTTTIAALGFTVFAASITLGRSVGDRLTQLVGSMRMLRWGGAVMVLGTAALISTRNPAAAFAGVILCGLGLSSLSPRILAAVGRISGHNTSALTRVIGLSTVGNFTGPPALGTIAAVLGLPIAMTIPAACGMLVSLNARVIDR